MMKGKALKKGDKVAIVSLSDGKLGEDFCKYSLEIGTRRLEEFGLVPVFMPNCLKGIEYINNNPKKRAEDLKEAFRDNSIKGIICAIGGIDTYKTLPYLLEDNEFVELVKNNPKVFTGYSDSTTNHFMFFKLGLVTYYGINFLTDLAELGEDMLPYTKNTFAAYFDGISEIVSSDVWYEEREDFSKSQVGVDRIAHKEEIGYEVLQGNSFCGTLLGGCIETIYDMLCGGDGEKEIIDKYELFPSKEEWIGKVLFVETSESKSSPELLEKMLMELKNRGVFESVTGVIVGKPQNMVYYEQYKDVWKKVVGNSELGILYNINFGHAHPKTVLAYGVEVYVDVNNKTLKYKESLFSDM